MITERPNMRLLIINNLSSGYRDGAIYDFARSFLRDGDEVCLRSTSGETRIEDLIEGASSFDAVVASGGDGTVATVSYCLRNTGIPVLPFPAGTANLLALNLASPNEPHALSKLVRSGRTLDFDIGELVIQDKTYGFEIMAGAGYDAVIMNGAKPTKKIFGSLAYVSAALTNPLPQKSKFTIIIDGQTIYSEGVGILIANFSRIQFDIPITHDNKPRDGKLDIIILKGSTAFDLIPAFIAGIRDRAGEYPDRSEALEIHSAESVEVHADPPLEVQYDGEPVKLTTPFKVRVLKRAVRYYISEEGYDLFA